jgi:2'-5' RNA ligase
MRPTHFVHIQFTNEDLIKNIVEFQDEIVKYHSVLNVPPQLFHVTLNVLHLNEQMCIHTMKYNLSNLLLRIKPFTLRLKGIDGFKTSNVTFIKFDDESEEMLRFLRCIMNDSWFKKYIPQDLEYHPHLTVTRGYVSKFGTLAKDLAEYEFGEQLVDRIHVTKFGKIDDTLQNVVSVDL